MNNKGILQIGKNDMMHQAQTFVYANGKDQPPTAIDHKKEMVKDLFFNQSPSKVSSLFSLLSSRPIILNFFLNSFLCVCVCVGCCIGVTINEVYAFCAGYGKALSIGLKLRLGSSLLRGNPR